MKIVTKHEEQRTPALKKADTYRVALQLLFSRLLVHNGLTSFAMHPTSNSGTAATLSSELPLLGKHSTLQSNTQVPVVGYNARLVGMIYPPPFKVSFASTPATIPDAISIYSKMTNHEKDLQKGDSLHGDFFFEYQFTALKLSRAPNRTKEGPV